VLFLAEDGYLQYVVDSWFLNINLSLYPRLPSASRKAVQNRSKCDKQVIRERYLTLMRDAYEIPRESNSGLPVKWWKGHFQRERRTHCNKGPVPKKARYRCARRSSRSAERSRE